MARRKGPFVRVTVTVPKHIRDRMQSHKGKINWSSVVANAIENFLDQDGVSAKESDSAEKSDDWETISFKIVGTSPYLQLKFDRNLIESYRVPSRRARAGLRNPTPESPQH